MRYRDIKTIDQKIAEREAEFTPGKLIPDDVADVLMTVKCPHCRYEQNQTLGGYIDHDGFADHIIRCPACGAQHEFPSLTDIERLIIEARQKLAQQRKFGR